MIQNLMQHGLCHQGKAARTDRLGGQGRHRNRQPWHLRPMFEQMGLSTGSTWTAWSLPSWRLVSTRTATTASSSSTPITRAGRKRQHDLGREHGRRFGAAWYLLCTTQSLKPIILQKRRDFQFNRTGQPDRPERLHAEGVHLRLGRSGKHRLRVLADGLGVEAAPDRRQLCHRPRCRSPA